MRRHQKGLKRRVEADRTWLWSERTLFFFVMIIAQKDGKRRGSREEARYARKDERLFDCSVQYFTSQYSPC